MSRLLYFLYNRLTDGSEVVGLMHWLPFTPRKISGTYFCWPQVHSMAGRIRWTEKSNDLIANQTCDLLRIVSQPTILQCTPIAVTQITGSFEHFQITC
jgi:hypothetical protein